MWPIRKTRERDNWHWLHSCAIYCCQCSFMTESGCTYHRNLHGYYALRWLGYQRVALATLTSAESFTKSPRPLFRLHFIIGMQNISIGHCSGLYQLRRIRNIILLLHKVDPVQSKVVKHKWRSFSVSSVATTKLASIHLFRSQRNFPLLLRCVVPSVRHFLLQLFTLFSSLVPFVRCIC